MKEVRTRTPPDMTSATASLTTYSPNTCGHKLAIMWFRPWRGDDPCWLQNISNSSLCSKCIKCVCKISAETLSKDSPGVTCSRVRSTFVFCSFVTRTWLARNTNSTSQRQSLDALRQRCQTIPLKDQELVYNLSTHGDRCTSFDTHHIWTSSPGLQPSTRSFSRMTHIDLGMEPTSSFWTCSWILISW